MPSLREVKRVFEELLSDNDKAVRGLESTISKTRADAAPSEKLYETMVGRFATSLFSPSVDTETLVAIKTATGQDFEKLYRDQMTAIRDAEIRLNGLTATHGTETALAEASRGFNQRIEAGESARTEMKTVIVAQEKTLAPVDTFNDKAKLKGRQPLEKDGIDFFSSKSGFKHYWAVVFDGHYREGRSIIASIPENIPQLQSDRAEHKEVLTGLEEGLKGMREKKAGVDTPLKEIRLTADMIKPESAVVANVSTRVISAMADTSFFNKAAAALPFKISPHLVEVRAKVEGFRKLETSARKNITSLKAASAKLETPLRKIRKAVSAGASKNLSIDLPKIKQGFKTGQIMAGHKSTEVNKASAAIRNYTSDSASQTTSAYISTGPSPLDFYMGFMIADMLSNHHDVNIPTPDPHVINDSLGIPDNIATDIGIDLGNLVPSLSDDALSGLSQSFNDISVGNIDVSVPDFTMPDISVPDISIPDISVSVDVGSSFDFGS